MGRPVHYSSEVPQRCQALIEMLSARIDEAADPEGLWGGPLKTTFLLAMATPLVVLPMERIFKPARARAGAADDTGLDPILSERVATLLGEDELFAAAPFFRARAWRYLASTPAFPVAGDWPGDRLAALAGDAALEAAASATARTILHDRPGDRLPESERLVAAATFLPMDAPVALGRLARRSLPGSAEISKQGRGLVTADAGTVIVHEDPRQAACEVLI